MTPLQQAAAALASAEASHTKAADAQNNIAWEIQAARRNLAEARTEQDAAVMAMALGEEPAQTVEDADTVKLEREISAYERAAPVAKQRLTQAEGILAAAKKRYSIEAQKHIDEEYLQPAQDRMSKALDGLQIAMAELSAATYVAKHDFASSDGVHWLGNGAYGPAADLLRQIVDPKTWGEYPYSIRPDWLPKSGPVVQPWTLRGFQEARAALLKQVDEAAR